MASTTYNFDSGTPGASVTAGGGIDTVAGTNPLYTVGVHGAAAVRTNGGTTASSTFRVLTSVGGVYSGSVYFMFNLAPSGAFTTFLQAQTSGNANIFVFRARQDGGLQVQNGATAVYDSAATGLFVAGRLNRLDWQYNWVSGGPTTLSWRLYTGTNAETTVYADSGTVTITAQPTTAAGKVTFGPISGTSGANRDMTFDTVRFTDGLSWFSAFAPVAPDTTPPAAPTGLTATAGNNVVALEWNDNTEPDRAGYNVFRSTTSTVALTAPLNAAPLAASDYSDTTVLPDTQYWYRVVALDASGNVSAASSTVSATPSAPTTSYIYAFDGMPLGSPITPAAPITDIVTATPTWDVGIHGDSAIRCNGGTTSGCNLHVALPVTGSHSGSLYLKMNVMLSSGTITVLQYQTATNANVLTVRSNGSGQLMLRDGATDVYTSTKTGLFGAADLPVRFDYQYVYTEGQTGSLNFRLFVGYNYEGTVPDDSGTIALASSNSAPITKVLAGPISGTAGAPRDVTYDTLRFDANAATWFEPFGVAPTPVAVSDFSVISAQTASGFTVRSRLRGVDSLPLLVCSDAAATNVVATVPAAAPVDAYGYITHTVTGLTPHTLYYAQLDSAGTRVGAVLRARTAPTPKTPTDFTFAMGSCMTNRQVDGQAFDDMTAWDPDFLLHAGDFHYFSSTSTAATAHVAQWETQIAEAGGIKANLANVPIYYQRSDHEAGPDATDSNNAYTAASIAGYKVVFPTPPLPDTRTNTSTYYSFPYGRVKVICIDFRSTDRSPGLDPQSPAKTALGQQQKDWLKRELLDADYPVKVILSDVAWIGPTSTTPGDKWWSYNDERTEIGNFITTYGINVFFMHGDTHALQADDGTSNLWGGFAVVNGGPLGNQGGGYNVSLQQVYNTGMGVQARQYQRVRVTDNGTTITVNAVGWDVMSGGIARTNLTKTYSTTGTPPVDPGDPVPPAAAPGPLNAVPNLDYGSVTVSLNWPGATAPATATIVRVAESGAVLPMRNAEPVDLVSGAFVGIDYEAPFGETFYYQATTTEPGFAPISSSSIILDTARSMLKHPGQPALNTWITVELGPKLDRPITQGIHDVLGRSTPIAVSMRRSSIRGELSLLTFTADERKALLALVDDGTPLLLATPRGYGLGNVYLAVGDVSEERLAGYGLEPTRRWTLPFVVVDRPTGGAQPAGNSWADVLGTYTSWQAALQVEGTWAGVLQGLG